MLRATCLFILAAKCVGMVVSQDGKLLGEVKGINGARDTGVDDAAGRGYATSGNDASVVIFSSCLQSSAPPPAATVVRPSPAGTFPLMVVERR